MVSVVRRMTSEGIALIGTAIWMFNVTAFSVSKTWSFYVRWMLWPWAECQQEQQQHWQELFRNNPVVLQICLKITSKMNMTFIGSCFVTYISVVKPTRCTNVWNLFYFGMILYMFRTVFPSIIRSSRLYIEFHLVPPSKQTAVSVWQMPVAVCTVLNPDDGRKDRPKHV